MREEIEAFAGGTLMGGIAMVLTVLAVTVAAGTVEASLKHGFAAAEGVGLICALVLFLVAGIAAVGYVKAMQEVFHG